MTLIEPLGLSKKGTADKKGFMILCEARLTTLYKDLEQDYDRVHGTAKVGDLGEMTQEGQDASLDEVKSTGSYARSVVSNNSWEMAGSIWEQKGKEDFSGSARSTSRG